MAGLREELETLPLSLSTLKRSRKGQLLLLKMRRNSLPLGPEQLQREVSSNKEDLYFFDPLDLFEAISISKILEFAPGVCRVP